MNEITSVRPVERLTATDLQALFDAQQKLGVDGEAYVVEIEGSAESMQVLVVPSVGRAGVAWGADAVWTDIQATEGAAAAREAVERYLSGRMVA